MAQSKNKITQYIKDFCRLYSLSYEEFFYDFDENDIPCPTPLFGEKSIESQLPKISEYFGLTHDEILSASDAGLRKWYKKYSFFYHYPRFMEAYFRADLKNENEFDEARLAVAIFGGELKKNTLKRRYDMRDIRSRLVAKLKEFNAVMPGTYHEDAEIKGLRVETENFCSYPQTQEMVCSLLQMIYRVKELFFKAKEIDLEQDEIYEYNFLVSVLGIKDVASNNHLYYRYVVALRSVYEQEGYSDFYSYARLTRYKNLYPWHSKEFLDNKDLLQAYINEYAEHIAQYRADATNVSKLYCFFTWSDAPIIEDPFEDDSFDKALFADISNVDIQQPTVVYLDKTKEELRGDEKYADKLLTLFGCPNRGGITIYKRELPFDHWRKNTQRMIAHAEALKGVNHD